MKWGRYLLDDVLDVDAPALILLFLERIQAEDLDRFYQVILAAGTLMSQHTTGNIKLLKLVFGMCDPTSVS